MSGCTPEILFQNIFDILKLFFIIDAYAPMNQNATSLWANPTRLKVALNNSPLEKICAL
jgi:hypothetical protein